MPWKAWQTPLHLTIISFLKKKGNQRPNHIYPRTMTYVISNCIFCFCGFLHRCISWDTPGVRQDLRMPPRSCEHRLSKRHLWGTPETGAPGVTWRCLQLTWIMTSTKPPTHTENLSLSSQRWFVHLQKSNSRTFPGHWSFFEDMKSSK